jgi:hypothetical protein
MLRYHMAVLTRDNALKRAVRRLTTATGSTVDFAVEPTALKPDPVHLYVLDARGQDPFPAWRKACSPDARFIFIIEGDSVAERVGLLDDPRATSLFAYDERFDDGEFIASATKALRGDVFGLQKYFPWGVTALSMVVRSYQEKLRAIDVLTEYAAVAGCRGSVRERIQVVGDELMANALYHAPVDEQGRELYAGKTGWVLSGEGRSWTTSSALATAPPSRTSRVVPAWGSCR